MICNDVNRYAEELAARIDECNSTHKVICIPGCMQETWFGTGPLDYWKGKHVVVANSNPNGCGSFITNTKGEREIFCKRRNTISLKTWAQLETEPLLRTDAAAPLD